MHITSMMRRRAAGVSVLVAALGAAACSDIAVPDYNRASTGDLVNAPNATLVNAASLGLLQNARRDVANRVRLVGIVGREDYYLDTNESRYVTELVTANIDPSAFSGNHDFSNPYGTIAQGQIILTAIDKVGANDYTTAQREALRGYTLTLMGNDLLIVAYMHQYGPTEVNPDPLADPQPMKTQAEMYTKAAQLLDDAVAHLKAGGSAFPFGLPSGFTQFSAQGFSNPSGGFLKFNRALRARLDVLRRDYPAAKIHLDSSFVSTGDASRTGMNTGVYYTFSGASGDLANGLSAGTPEVAEPSLKTDAQLQPSGAPDARYTLKIDEGAARTQLGITSTLRFALYKTRPFYGSGTTASPIPWARNEEMILERSEARWFTGDKVGAMADLNFVRTNSGGLAAIATTPATDDDYVTALLYERRYSVLYEAGWRWLDYRRFNRLPAFTNYPRQGDKSLQFFPIPFTECLARGGAGSAPGC